LRRRLEMPKTCLCRSLGRSLCPIHPSVRVAPAAAASAPAKAAPKPEPKKKPEPKAEAPKPKPAPAPPKPEPKKPEPKVEAKAEAPKGKNGDDEYYTYDELSTKTKRELIRIAAENKIDLPRKASKAEIVSLLLGE
jgi:outer membrane biosynthesis protein TonB